MLVESIIKKTLDLKSYRIEKVYFEGEMLVAEIDADRRWKLVCSGCGRKVSGYDSLAQRSWYHVPCWGIPVRLLYHPRRGDCPECGIKVEAIPWSRGKSSLSLPLMVVLAAFAKRLPWEDVSCLFGLHWNTVKAAVKHVVDYGLEHRNLSGIIYIGIDELSRRRGHTYVTMIYDLGSGALLWTGDGREKETLKQFFAEWGQERIEAIQGICCDMWEPYADVIRELAPQAVLVFDKFHIVKHLMEAVDEVRRQETAEKGKEHKELVKGTRYIWLKNPWNLTEKQSVRLSQLEKLNLKINRAYLLKEQFRQFWDFPCLKEAGTFLKQWFWLATHSRLKPLRDFAWMLRRHEQDILNYFKLKITAGRTEGRNRKARVVSQRCYGFRTFGTLRLALYHSLGNLPVPELPYRFV
jgi:transposase